MNTKKGFTFVEVMMAALISTFVLFAVVGFYMMSQRAFFSGAEKSELVLGVKNAINIMTEELARIERIEEMTVDNIRFKMKPYKVEDMSAFGVDDLIDITYILDRRNGELKRVENYQEKVILSASYLNIKDEKNIPMFTPYMLDSSTGKASIYKPDYTDTEKQSRLVYIKIRLYAELSGEKLDLVTGVRLEFMHANLLQPDWKF
ncbi:MAG: hypothetical protein WC337_03865 [Candidatus Muiribacteriota bacterium]